MDLWSKGLGRLVLKLRLQERAGIEAEGCHLVMRGTMGKPTHWDWSVELNEDDISDFLAFLMRPAPIRFMVESDARWTLLRVALAGALSFALRTARCFLLGPPRTGGVASRDEAHSNVEERA